MINVLFIIILVSLLLVIVYTYLYRKENVQNISELGKDLVGFPVRYFDALKSAFESIKLYIGYIPDYEKCAPDYTEFPLTCTKGCGGFYNHSWGTQWCNGPKEQPNCHWWGCLGWNDCYKTWIVDCFKYPANTYNRRAICKGTDEEKAGLCYPKGYL